MKIRKWISKNVDKPIDIKNKIQKNGGENMENILVLDDYKNEAKTECEWDMISDIFSKAIKRKSLSKTQVQDISKKILNEVRNKCE